jgi:hypothetical protein
MPRIRSRPPSKTYRMREQFVRWIAESLDVPVATHVGEGAPPNDYDPRWHGRRFLFIFKRYNHRRDGITAG